MGQLPLVGSSSVMELDSSMLLSYGVRFLNEVVPISAALEPCRKSRSGVARASGTVVRGYECTSSEVVNLPTNKPKACRSS